MKGNEAYQQGKYDLAITYYTKAIVLIIPPTCVIWSLSDLLRILSAFILRSDLLSVRTPQRTRHTNIETSHS